MLVGDDCLDFAVCIETFFNGAVMADERVKARLPVERRARRKGGFRAKLRAKFAVILIAIAHCR